MSEQLHNNLSSFTQGKLNISAKIVIFLRDKECSDVSSEAKIDINKFPLKFTVRIAYCKPCHLLQYVQILHILNLAVIQQFRRCSLNVL